MDFTEDVFDEDIASCNDAESTLYSVVHHSMDSYDCNKTNTPENYVTYQSKVNRWNDIKKIQGTEKIGNNHLHRDKVFGIEALDVIPLDSHRNTHGSESSHKKPSFKRKNNIEYPWNNQHNEKPWNIQDRIRYSYIQNRSFETTNLGRSPGYQNNFVMYPNLSRNNFNFSKNQRNIFQNDLIEKQRHLKFKKQVQSNPHSLIKDKNDASVTHETLLTNAVHNPYHEGDSRKNCDSQHNEKPITTSFENEADHFNGDVHKQRGDFCRNKTFKSNASINNQAGSTDKHLASEDNISDEIVVVSDSNDDNDSNHSIVEVSLPPKSEPPIIVLDSSDETESLRICNTIPDLNIPQNAEESIVSVVEISSDSPVTPKTCKKATESLFAPSFFSTELKKKNKRKGKKKMLQGDTSGCKTWTVGMSQFYNQSWGGESYDHVKLQQHMTSDPTKWKILDVDKYGPVRNFGPLARSRCANCHQLGHLMKQCPDPRKIKCCSMCGEQGHGENQCPKRLCFQCGRPAPLFKEGCTSCCKRDHPSTCTICGAFDHFQWLCPNVWRKFHSITTTEELQAGILQEPMNKSNRELSCCFCARRGHSVADCQLFSKKSNNASLDIISTFNVLNRKREKRSSFFEGRQYNGFHAKRRRMN